MADTNTGIEAIGTAAGAISKAIGDIYRGQLAATQEKPGLEESAQRRVGQQQEMLQKAQKFPLEMAQTRQSLQMGNFALEEAPLKIQHLKSTIAGQGFDNTLKSIAAKSAGDVYKQTSETRDAVRQYLSTESKKPGNEWMGAYINAPDAFLDMWSKMKIEESKAEFKRPSFDQVLGVLAEKKAKGLPLTPEEQKVYDQGVAWKMKTSAGGIGPSTQLHLQQQLYKEANDAANQSFQTMFGKDFSKLPGVTQMQKQQTVQYYKSILAQQAYDANPAYRQGGLPRPQAMPKPAWVSEYEDQAIKKAQPGGILNSIWGKFFGTPPTPQFPQPQPAPQPEAGGDDWTIKEKQ